MQPSTEFLAELTDPVKSAEIVGLHYVTDERPGIRREPHNGGFRYRDPQGQLLRDSAVLKRIKALAIPPAWSDVWICPDPGGHLQATGRDMRGRKQFRYHARWREIRDETKYARMISFAKALPQIRRRVKRDLALPGLPRAKVLAAVVRLLKLTLIRVGNDEYARHNDSFGLTTLRDRHAAIRGGKVRFHFRGKSGKWHDINVNDPRLARIVKNCQDLPGQELFQFLDEAGTRRDVTSGDVNAYLREICGEEFTAKDFRTWAGTVLAATALSGCPASVTKADSKRNITAAIARVAERLGNTPAVCRKCYVHPHVLDSYLDGTLVELLQGRAKKKPQAGSINDCEAAVIRLLTRRLTLEQQLKRSLRAPRKK